MAVSLHHVVIDADATAPVGICFLPVTDAKTTKNRLHLDLSPDPGEQEAEVVHPKRTIID